MSVNAYPHFSIILLCLIETVNLAALNALRAIIQLLNAWFAKEILGLMLLLCVIVYKGIMKILLIYNATSAHDSALLATRLLQNVLLVKGKNKRKNI